MKAGFEYGDGLSGVSFRKPAAQELLVAMRVMGRRSASIDMGESGMSGDIWSPDAILTVGIRRQSGFKHIPSRDFDRVK